MVKIYKAFLPFIAKPSAPELKAGLAASSHKDITERVRLLGGVAGVRGWKLGASMPEKIGGADYVPCWWCDMSAEVRGGKAVIRDQMHVPKLAEKRGTPLLFLNEPDVGRGQCDITPHRAAVLYLYMKETMPDLKLIGLGISHLDYLNGFQWLGLWIEQVIRLSGKVPEFWAWDLHHYIIDRPPLAPIDALQDFLLRRGVVTDRFYISEWGACTPERVEETRRAFDADPRIVKHFYYCQYEATWDGDGRCTSLFVEGSKPLRLSDLGEAWVRAGQ